MSQSSARSSARGWPWQFFEISGAILLALDPDGRVSYINQKGAETLGHPVSEVLGKNWFESFLPARVRGEVVKGFCQLRAGAANAPERFENPVLCRDGSERIIAWRNAVIRAPSGRVVVALSSGEDVTEQRRAETALRESELRFRATFEQVAVGMAHVGLDARFLRLNNRLCEITGYSRAELEARTFGDITHPDDLGVDLVQAEALRTGRIPHYTMEKRYIRKDGSVVWVAISDLSLPALTVVLAGIDGFNPCAMWVLVFLIGLLLGVADSRRMWLLGGTFLLTTGVMYFAVMTAWLNVVLWIGAVGWLRIAIGALAVGAGLYYLREYWTNLAGSCRVTPSRGRARLTEALRGAVGRPSLPLAALAVAGLAIVVNLVELVCSAGVPAIYTQVLAMHDLSLDAEYAYILLYLFVFLIDDALIFVTAMLTLRAAAVAGRYARSSHLIGGGVLLALGSVMILRPEWLG